jgi:hypothetical protein
MSRAIWSKEADVCCGAERRVREEERSRRKGEEESAGEGSMDWKCVDASCESCALRALVFAAAALISAWVVVVELLGVLMDCHEECQEYSQFTVYIVSGYDFFFPVALHSRILALDFDTSQAVTF